MKIITILLLIIAGGIVEAQSDDNWYSNPSLTAVSIEDEGIYLSRVGISDKIKMLTYTLEIDKDRNIYILNVDTSIYPNIDYSSITRIYVGYALIHDQDMTHDNIVISMYSKGNNPIIGNTYLFNSSIKGLLPEKKDYRLIITCVRIVYGMKSIESYNDLIIKQYFNGEWYFKTNPTVKFKIKGQ
jgi:hypothetical protein